MRVDQRSIIIFGWTIEHEILIETFFSVFSPFGMLMFVMIFNMISRTDTNLQLHSESPLMVQQTGKD